MYNSAKREIVIEASNEHYDTLYNAIKELTETEHELDLTLTILAFLFQTLSFKNQAIL